MAANGGHIDFMFFAPPPHPAAGSDAECIEYKQWRQYGKFDTQAITQIKIEGESMPLFWNNTEYSVMSEVQ